MYKHENHDFEKGDVFVDDTGHVTQIMAVGDFGEYLTATDPTVHHPQAGRAGEWELVVSELEAALESGRVERTTLITE